MSHALALPLQPNPAEAEAVRPRRAPLAVLLSLYDPTLAYLYVGRPGRGLVLLAAVLTWTVLCLYASLAAGSTPARLFAMLLMAAPRMAMAVDAASIARREGAAFRLRPYNR